MRDRISAAVAALALACVCVMPAWAKEVTLADWGTVDVPNDTRVIWQREAFEFSPWQEAVKIEPIESKEEPATPVHPMYAWALEQQKQMKELADSIRITAVPPTTDTHETVITRRPAWRVATFYQVLGTGDDGHPAAAWITTTADRPEEIDTYDLKWHMGQREWKSLIRNTVLNEAWLAHVIRDPVTVTAWEPTYTLDAGMDEIYSTGARVAVHLRNGEILPLAVRVYGRYSDGQIRFLTVVAADNSGVYFRKFTDKALRGW